MRTPFTFSISDVPEIQKIGVYAIHNTKNGKYYIGSTVNITNRLCMHSRDIRLHGGINCKMKNDMKSGSSVHDFEFVILRLFEDGEITQEQLREQERTFINKYDTYSGHNDSHFPPLCSYRIPVGVPLFASKTIVQGTAENCEKIYVTVPKGKKEQIKTAAESSGKSLNGYINEAIDEKMQAEQEETT